MKFAATAVVLVILFATATAHAKDYAVVLNDNEKQVLLNLLDIATKSQGLAVAQSALFLAQKINTAGEVVEHKDAVPAAPPAPSAPPSEDAPK
jgi:hypothetical protein